MQTHNKFINWEGHWGYFFNKFYMIMLLYLDTNWRCCQYIFINILMSYRQNRQNPSQVPTRQDEEIQTDVK